MAFTKFLFPAIFSIIALQLATAVVKVCKSNCFSSSLLFSVPVKNKILYRRDSLITIQKTVKMHLARKRHRPRYEGVVRLKKLKVSDFYLIFSFFLLYKVACREMNKSLVKKNSIELNMMYRCFHIHVARLMPSSSRPYGGQKVVSRVIELGSLSREFVFFKPSLTTCCRKPLYPCT